MKGYNGWSYRPYRPFLIEIGDIYICRIAPGKNTIFFEWLGESGEYRIFVRKRGEEVFLECGITTENAYRISQLEENIDYEFYVSQGEKTSRVRMARTGEAVGTVVNYLHPDDKAYLFSGNYLCSPSLVKYPDGTLLASMDIYEMNTPQNLTLIFRSDDNGENWHYVSELMPCFWGEMFLHNGELYMLSCSTEFGDLLIGKSTDKGKTFTTPVPLLRGSGRCYNPGIHKNPQTILKHNGRIYETLECIYWGERECQYGVMVMSCDEKSDLLSPDSWHFTPPTTYNQDWPGTVEGYARGNIEGTLCISPKGEMLNVMRYTVSDEAIPEYGLVLAYKVNTDNPDAPLEYSHSINFPGNNAKFQIKYDEISKKYFSIICRIRSAEEKYARYLLSLMVSEDLDNWDLLCDLIDRTGEDMSKVGFQYVDFMFDREDLIFLCRTAMNNANNFHDANYSTFHRIEQFRELL